MNIDELTKFIEILHKFYNGSLKEYLKKNNFNNVKIIYLNGLCDIEMTVAEFVDLVKSNLEIKYTYFSFFNDYEITFGKYDIVSFRPMLDDEYYERAEYIIPIDLDDMSLNTNIEFAKILQLNSNDMAQYDYTSLVNSLLNETDLNVLLSVKYLCDNNIPLLYTQYPEFTTVVAKHSQVVRLWREQSIQ